MGHGGERIFQVSCFQLQLQLAVSLVEQISINLGPITFRINWGDFLIVGLGNLSELSELSPVWTFSRLRMQRQGNAQVNSPVLPRKHRAPGDVSGRWSEIGTVIKSSCLHGFGQLSSEQKLGRLTLVLDVSTVAFLILASYSLPGN